MFALVLILGIWGTLEHSGKQHYRKAWEGEKAAHSLTTAKLLVSNASIDTLSAAIAKTNQESLDRAKAFEATKAADDASRAELDRKYAGTQSQIDRLKAIAKAAGGSSVCKVPSALSAALEGL